MAVVHLHLLASALTVALLPTGIAASPVMCAGGHYKPGQAATITCHFNGNFQEGQTTSVYITRNDVHAPADSSGKKVLDCDVKGDSFSSCRPDENFRFIGFTKNHNMTVEIPDVSAEFQGRYTCGVVPSGGLTVKPCYLLVQGASGQGANDHRQTAEKDEELHGHVKTVIALLVIIILVAVIAILIIAYKKNWFFCGKRAKKQTIDDDVEAEMLPDSNRPGAMAVGYTSAIQESGGGPIYTGNKSSAAPEPPSSQKQPLIKGSQHASNVAGTEESADDRKVETKEEKQAREKREKEEEKGRKEKLREDLKKAASNEEKKKIQREFDENEKRIKQQRKEEEERLKREEKQEKERLKLQKKEEERLKREKKGQKKTPEAKD